MGRFLVFGAFIALVCVHPASAQDEQDTAVARTLFHEGIACADAGDYPCAADRLRRSQALRASPVVAFNLAQAEAELGHFVVASELYRSVIREAEGELALAAQASVDALAPRLAQVTVNVDTSARVVLDEFEMQPAMRGVAIPIDPGEHRLRAYYGDELAAESVFVVAEGESATHEFQVPPPAADLSVREIPDQSDNDESDNDASTGASQRRRRRRILGITLGTLAAVGVAVLLAVLLSPSAPDPTPTDLPPVFFE